MTRKRFKIPILEAYIKETNRKYVTYAQGASMYRLPYYSFVRVAKEAKANFPIRKGCIVDLDTLRDYLETHPEVIERLVKTRRKYNGK